MLKMLYNQIFMDLPYLQINTQTGKTFRREKHENSVYFLIPQSKHWIHYNEEIYFSCNHSHGIFVSGFFCLERNFQLNLISISICITSHMKYEKSSRYLVDRKVGIYIYF